MERIRTVFRKLRLNRYFYGKLRLNLSSGHRRLLGESLREIGVLLIVFVPLDVSLRDPTKSQQMIDSYYLPWLDHVGKQTVLVYFFAVFGLILLVLGIKIERDAEVEERMEGYR